MLTVWLLECKTDCLTVWLLDFLTDIITYIQTLGPSYYQTVRLSDSHAVILSDFYFVIHKHFQSSTVSLNFLLVKTLSSLSPVYSWYWQTWRSSWSSGCWLTTVQARWLIFSTCRLTLVVKQRNTTMKEYNSYIARKKGWNQHLW